jgi:hypothetical protein
MRGNFKSQVARLFHEIDGTGTSKFADKLQVREELKSQGQAATSSAVGARTAVHSNKTNEGYFDRCVELAKWARDFDGTNDVEKITAKHVSEFLAEKIDAGVSLSHWNGYSAAFSKLEQAQEKFALAVRGVERCFGYRVVTEALRPEAHAELHRFRGTRNYENPSALVSSMQSETGRLISAIQHESGLRITAAAHVTAGQLRGLITDKHTGEVRGQLQYVCKGGAILAATVSHRTYAALQSHILSNEELKMDHKAYRNELKAAAAATKQAFNSTHGLRWNYAQERFSNLRSRGVGYEKALGVVSSEMGHHRISITEHYVFGK